MFTTKDVGGARAREFEKFLQKLDQCRRDKKYCDLVVTANCPVDGEQAYEPIHCNKNILASWSPFFKRKLELCEPENVKSLTIPGINHFILEKLINMMYNPCIEPLFEESTMFDMFLGAKLLELEVQGLCEDYICSHRRVENCVTIWQFGVQNECEKLSGPDYIFLNLNQVVDTRPFLDLSYDQLKLLLPTPPASCSFNDILIGLHKWVRHVGQERVTDFLVLVKGLPIEKLQKETMIKIFEDDNLISSRADCQIFFGRDYCRKLFIQDIRCGSSSSQHDSNSDIKEEPVDEDDDDDDCVIIDNIQHNPAQILDSQSTNRNFKIETQVSTSPAASPSAVGSLHLNGNIMDSPGNNSSSSLDKRHHRDHSVSHVDYDKRPRMSSRRVMPLSSSVTFGSSSISTDEHLNDNSMDPPGNNGSCSSSLDKRHHRDQSVSHVDYDKRPRMSSRRVIPLSSSVPFGSSSISSDTDDNGDCSSNDFRSSSSSSSVSISLTTSPSRQQLVAYFMADARNNNNRELWSYNLQTQEEKFVTECKLNRHRGEILLNDDKIYFLGGKKDGDNGKETDDMSILELDNDPPIWSTETIPKMAEKRCDFHGVVLDDYIYVVGGCRGLDVMNAVEKLSLNQIKDHWTGWRKVQTMQCMKDNAAVGVVHGVIYSVGGLLSSNVKKTAKASKVVECFDPEDGKKWKYGPKMTTARLGAAVAVKGPLLYVFGGGTTYCQPWKKLKSVEVFDTISKKWKSLGPMKKQRQFFAAVEFGGYFYILGGDSDTKPTMERYNPETQKSADLIFDLPAEGDYRSVVFSPSNLSS